MKKDIHPQYFKNAKVACACGTKYTLGATRKEIQVEVCGNCHPFYTGEEKLIDTAGRVERFKKRRETAAAKPKARSKTVKKAEKRAKKESK